MAGSAGKRACVPATSSERQLCGQALLLAFFKEVINAAAASPVIYKTKSYDTITTPSSDDKIYYDDITILSVEREKPTTPLLYRAKRKTYTAIMTLKIYGAITTPFSGDKIYY